MSLFNTVRNYQRPSKKVGTSIYFHKTAWPEQPMNLLDVIKKVCDQASEDLGKEVIYNVIKIELRAGTVSFLLYEDFFDSPFPELISSITCKEVGGHLVKAKERKYNGNRPILHRKELLLLRKHPRYDEYSKLTKQCEDAGFFKKTSTIGYKQQWMEMLSEFGYILEGHNLKRII